jgi:hypothetical protein
MRYVQTTRFTFAAKNPLAARKVADELKKQLVLLQASSE